MQSSCLNRGSVGGYFLAGRNMNWVLVSSVDKVSPLLDSIFNLTSKKLDAATSDEKYEFRYTHFAYRDRRGSDV